MKFKNNYYLLLTIYCLLLIAYNAPLARAQSFNLQIDDIDTMPEKSTSSPTIENTDLNFSQSDDKEAIREGIQSISQKGPISFAASSDVLDFGQLTSGNPVVRKVDLSVTSEFSDFKMIAYEDHPIQTTNNDVIPDTTCDDGLCSESDASKWESNLTFGFGFRAECTLGLSCGNFTNKDYYKQLSTKSAGEAPSTLFSGSKDAKTQDASLIFKLNISGTQPSGIYSNTITLIAVPNF